MILRPAFIAKIQSWVVIYAACLWFYYLLLHKVFGPLNIDEYYFSHTMWLVRSGLSSYLDFSSLHLPYFFKLYNLFLPISRTDDLRFIIMMRMASFAIIVTYIAMLSLVTRKHFIYLVPLLFIYLIVGRATEIRADTIGLLLFNIAWGVLIAGRFRHRATIAAFVAGLALFFSARAAVMAPGMAIACFVLIFRQGRSGNVVSLLVAGAVISGLIASLYFANPEQFSLMVRSVYLEASQLNPRVSLSARLFELERSFLLIIIFSGLAGAALAFRQDRQNDPALMVIIAVIAQLVLVVVDPSPFHYVYSWALIPAIAGLAIGFNHFGFQVRTWYVAIVAMISIALPTLSLSYSVLKGRVPPTTSNLRLTFDQSLAARTLRTMELAALIDLSISLKGQQNLLNQLAIKSEICRRIDAPVLTRFNASPICLPDVRHEWYGLTWPDLYVGGKFPQNRREFEQLFETRPPALVAWGSQYYSPPLTPWGARLLKDYVIFNGYALRRPVPDRRTP